MSATLHPGTLIVASAMPDPPFELSENGIATGFDIRLMQAICGQMGLILQLVRFTGANFNDIFDYLENGTCDAVISGTTITPERSAIVLFSRPYLEFNQGVAINRVLTPSVSSVAGLRGLTAGIQSGNTSDAVAKRWLAENAIADIRYYPYDGIATALNDLEAGRIGFVVKLHPVISWLYKPGRRYLSPSRCRRTKSSASHSRKTTPHCARKWTMWCRPCERTERSLGCRRIGFPHRFKKANTSWTGIYVTASRAGVRVGFPAVDCALSLGL